MSRENAPVLAARKVYGVVDKVDSAAYKTMLKRLFYNDVDVTLSANEK